MRFLFFILLLLPFLSFSQGNSANFSILPIKGVVYDSVAGDNLEFVSIRAFSNSDSSIITGALTDGNGSFQIDKINTKNIYLVVSFVGYESKVIDKLSLLSSSILLNLRIGLKPSGLKNLDEVKIQGEKAVLTSGIDKKVYNVSGDLNTQGGTASDVLNNVPSIEVDQDGNISLRGDGNVIILIDGRPSTLTLNNGLSGLPANSVERVEVVTNPSAKYDPDGTSGIINIVLKKSKLRGVNGIVSATGGTGYLLNGTASFNARTGKFNAFGNYSNRYSTGFRNFYSSLERTSGTGVSLLEQERPGTHLRKNQTLRLGMDYFLTDKQTVGFSVTGSLGDQERFGDLSNVFYDEESFIADEFSRTATDVSDDQNLDLNVNYTGEFKKKGKLIVNLTTSIEDETNAGDYRSTFLTDGYFPSNREDLVQRVNNIEDNRVSTGQLDYEKVLPKKGARFETGAKVILRNEDVGSFSETFDTIQEVFAADTLANFNYNYTEEIYAVYGIWGQKVKNWKYQIGVRGEYAKQVPNLKDDNLKITNEYFNLFPSAHLRYELQKKQEISLSYSRRINRPRSRTLNPFVNYSDPLNLRYGNPYLTPEYINSLDLGYSKESKKFNFTSSIYYRYTTDVIQRFKIFGENGVTGTTWGNIDESQSYGVEMVVNYKPKKWWRNTISINGNQTQFINTEGESDFNTTGLNFNMKYATTVDFWKKTASFQVNIRYNTPRVTPQGRVLPRSVMDISASKKLNDHWSLSSRLSDVFNTQGFQYNLSQGSISQQGDYKWLTRRLYLTITYKFGKLEMTKRQSRSGGSQGGGGMDF